MRNSILFIIPARSGSKRLKDKNKKILVGKPLIQHSIDFAKKVCKDGDKVLVTTDDKGILEISKTLKVDFIINRPGNLCSDKALTEDVLIHAINNIEFKPKWIVLLQPTSPIRSIRDFRNIMKLANNDIETEIVVSISEHKIQTNNVYKIKNEEKLEIESDVTISINQYFFKNGSYYVIDYSKFKRSGNLNFHKIKGYITKEEFSIDIDTLLDFQLAEVILKSLDFSKN